MPEDEDELVEDADEDMVNDEGNYFTIKLISTHDSSQDPNFFMNVNISHAN